MACFRKPHIAEGVFAIHKPKDLTSAQVIRDAQAAFKDSKLFQPWFERERNRLDDESHNQKQKRRSWKSKQPVQVKMGHGGTLDPMATGVLILGVGSGTKTLGNFLECTKSYETVVLFGAATDTYDAVGKLVAQKDYSHITKEMVEEKLADFRGEIMQKPPIYSALKVNGKKMYEYAREGKELPIEIEARPVEVLELEMTEWMEAGTHDFSWPREEAERKEKDVVDKVLKLEDGGADTAAGAKRKRDDGEVEDQEEDGVPLSPKRVKPSSEAESQPAEPTMSGALPKDAPIPESTTDSTTTSGRCPAPACRLRMTVTSGFYVRSLAHDLGAAVGSLALMSSLVRSRQGDFALHQESKEDEGVEGADGNVLDYSDLAKGEEVWAPKVERMLKQWQEKMGETGNAAGSASGKRNGGADRKDGERKRNPPKKRRRNSSSPDSP